MILSPHAHQSPSDFGLPVALAGGAQAPSEFLQKTLDSLAAHIAILDENGVVIAVNSAWKTFAERNGFRGRLYGLGSNYLDICESATGADADEAPDVLLGLRAVISGSTDEFYLEYPCHSPTENRWFALRATRFWGDGDITPTRVVVAHENITGRKEIELLLREETRIIETLYRVGQVVAGELDVARISVAVIEAAVELCDAQLGFFLPCDTGLGAPTLCDARQKSQTGRLQTAPFQMHDLGAPDQYLGQQKMICLSDARQEDEIITPFSQSDFGNWSVASFLAVGVFSRSGQRLGALFLGHEKPQKFNMACERIIVGLASQAALATENALLYEAARREKDAATQAENRARFVTESIAHLVWIANADGQHEYYNQRWFDYTGLSREESLAGAWPVVLHPEESEAVQRKWSHSLQTGQLYEVEYRLRRHDGEYRWFLGRALPQRGENGQILNWFGTCTDIHDAKTAEEGRRVALENEAKARQEAETANRIKDEFLAVVSHELRTPLTPILGWMEMLKGDEPEAMLRAQAYEVIERNARAQSQIINDLLDVSRIITGKLRLDLRPVDLVRVIQSALETVESAARAKGVKLHYQQESDSALAVADDDRLRQVVWNLVSNAVKFTPNGGEVWVSLRKEAGAFVLEVNDSGAGIEPEFLPYVFERFRQADASSTRRHGGLGLGLSIVKYIVSQHGGEISAFSAGKHTGTTFTVRLPNAPVFLTENKDEKTEKPSQVKTAFVAPKDALIGLQILVIEDEEDARDMLRATLKIYGARVQTAASVAEGLHLLDQFLPDLVISDIGMPGEDGYSLIQKLRARPPETGGRVPAVALTAYARAEDRARALSSGFQNHIAKPIVPAELVVTLAALAGRVSYDGQ